MNLIKTFPTLFSNSSNGTKEWTITVWETDGVGIICSVYGLIIGKKQTSEVAIKKGKNIGKRNETTPVEQALKEATSKWKKKLRTSFESLAELDSKGNKYTSPMLALQYSKRSHNIEFPCFVQPKLDGVRCVTKEVNKGIFVDIEYMSRTGHEFKTLDILSNSLHEIFKYIDIELDGELFTSDIAFEEIVSCVKGNKNLNKLNNKLQYWVYDVIDTKSDFIKRNIILNNIFLAYGEFDILKQTHHIGNIYLCPTHVVNNKEEILELHESFVEAGYEGTIIRNMKGFYKLGPSRSKDLQKKKDFIDDEFEIVNILDGVGKDQETAIFFCKARNGKIFRVKPEGTWEQRHEWFLNKDHLIGKQLTVKYQCLSRYGIPKFATGITVRNYE